LPALGNIEIKVWQIAAAGPGCKRLSEKDFPRPYLEAPCSVSAGVFLAMGRVKCYGNASIEILKH